MSDNLSPRWVSWLILFFSLTGHTTQKQIYSINGVFDLIRFCFVSEIYVSCRLNTIRNDFEKHSANRNKPANISNLIYINIVYLIPCTDTESKKKLVALAKIPDTNRMQVDSCKPDPCVNGGTCVLRKATKTHYCKCHGNYTGKQSHDYEFQTNE